jgi:hypothetical protein
MSPDTGASGCAHCNEYLRIIHAVGIHQVAVRWCEGWAHRAEAERQPALGAKSPNANSERVQLLTLDVYTSQWLDLDSPLLVG